MKRSRDAAKPAHVTIPAALYSWLCIMAPKIGTNPSRYLHMLIQEDAADHGYDPAALAAMNWQPETIGAVQRAATVRSDPFRTRGKLEQAREPGQPYHGWLTCAEVARKLELADRRKVCHLVHSGHLRSVRISRCHALYDPERLEAYRKTLAELSDETKWIRTTKAAELYRRAVGIGLTGIKEMIASGRVRSVAFGKLNKRWVRTDDFERVIRDDKERTTAITSVVEPGMIRAKEVMRILGVTRERVRQLGVSGIIRMVQVGGKVFYDRVQAEARAESRRGVSAPQDPSSETRPTDDSSNNPLAER